MLRVEKAVKRMRGASRSVHVVASNGWQYVVKPPMIGRRGLINEWLGSRLYQMLGVMAAEVMPILIPAELASELWPDATGSDMIGSASAFPVDPTRNAIFDLLPPKILREVANPDHLVASFAIDLWTGKAKPRHHVFFRQGPWWACAVGNRDLFGEAWDCNGSGNPCNPIVRWAYPAHFNETQCDLWADQIASIQPDALYRLVGTVPECWLDRNTQSDLLRLADLLLSRRDLVPAMLRGVAGTTPRRTVLRCDNMTVSASCLSK